MKRVTAPRYDLSKTVVAAILGIILILTLLQGCATNTVPATPAEAVSSPVSTEKPPAPALLTDTVIAASPTETLVPVSPTAKETAISTTSPAKKTAVSVETSLPTKVPDKATAIQGQSQNASCNTNSPSRLSVGQMARVLQRLNLRSDASIQALIIRVIPASIQVEIIGGPVCETVGKRDYLWWQIRLSDKTEGWSAEAPLRTGGYFLEPVQ
jgi:hypothetical protein